MKKAANFRMLFRPDVGVAPMIKAMGYLRVSGPSQLEGDGFPRQREAIETYARQHDIRIVRWFAEKAVPGKTEWEDRPAWSEMVLELNGVHTIVIEKLDRLARDLMVQEHIITDLTRRGIALVSVCEPDLMASDPTRILVRHMMGAIAQYEKSMLVLKLRASRDRKRKQTGRCEGIVPFGNSTAEQDVLEMVRAMRVEGLNWFECADKLNSMGIHTRPTRARPEGSQWYGANLRRLLSGPTPPDQKRLKCVTPSI